MKMVNDVTDIGNGSRNQVVRARPATSDIWKLNPTYENQVIFVYDISLPGCHFCGGTGRLCRFRRCHDFS